ncbi:MAG: glycosyltransferase [Acidobacteriota bacterium]
MTLATERIGPVAEAIGLPAGFPLGRFAPVRRLNRRMQAHLLVRRLARSRGLPRLLWLSDWWQIDVARRLGPGRCLVECQDDPRQVFAGSPSRLAELPDQRAAVLARADLIAAVDSRLLEGIRDGSGRFAVVPNGISREFLAAGAGEWPEPPALAGRRRPRLAVVAGEWSFEHRVDHELLSAALARLEGWTLLLVGVPRRPGPGLSHLLCQPGVVALPAQPHLDLVPLLRACDVGAVPYQQAAGRDALKTYEYLACGLPVVLTVDQPQPRLARWTAVVPDVAGFVAACTRLARDHFAEPEQVREILAGMTWERRAEALLHRLDAIRPPQEG